MPEESSSPGSRNSKGAGPDDGPISPTSRGSGDETPLGRPRAPKKAGTFSSGFQTSPGSNVDADDSRKSKKLQRKCTVVIPTEEADKEQTVPQPTEQPQQQEKAGARDTRRKFLRQSTCPTLDPKDSSKQQSVGSSAPGVPGTVREDEPQHRPKLKGASTQPLSRPANQSRPMKLLQMAGKKQSLRFASQHIDEESDAPPLFDLSLEKPLPPEPVPTRNSGKRVMQRRKTISIDDLQNGQLGVGPPKAPPKLSSRFASSGGSDLPKDASAESVTLAQDPRQLMPTAPGQSGSAASKLMAGRRKMLTKSKTLCSKDLDGKTSEEDIAGSGASDPNNRLQPGAQTVCVGESAKMFRSGAQNMKRTRCEAWLYSLPFLKSCSDEFVEELAPFMTREVFKEGTEIVRQGAPITSLFVITFGRVELLIEELHLSDLLQGHFFGEQIVCDAPCNATATAKAASVCMTYCLRQEPLRSLLQKFPIEVRHFQPPPLANQSANGDQSPRRSSNPSVSIYTIPMFNECDHGFLHHINCYLHKQIVFVDQLLMTEGQQGDTCIILNRGTVVVTVAARKVAELKDGSVFGELAVLGISETRSATVTATSVCYIQILHRVALRTALDQFPMESKRFHQLISTRALAHNTLDGSEMGPKRIPLRNVSFFKDCSDRFLHLLQDNLEERLYMAAQVVVEEGSDGDAIFIILRGTCEAVTQGEVVAQLKEGDVFGEMAALGFTEKTTATVSAKTSCFVQLLHRACFLNALDQCPDERRMFFKLSEQRMHKTTARMSISKPNLSSYALFKGCSEGFLCLLADSLQERLFLPGQEIVTEGTEGDTCFILHQGSAEVYKHDVHLTNYEPGSFFGEFAVLGLSTIREATVKALTVCMVEELQRDKLWEAIQEYPKESQIFEGLVMRHLETTVHEAMLRCSFFESCDQRAVTLLTLHATRRVVPPGQWIVRENFSGDAMFVLNRGTMLILLGVHEVGLMRAGDYICSTTMLGVHRMYPVSCKAKTMCHVIVVGRSEFLQAMKQYGVQRQWIKDLQQEEKLVFEKELKQMQERSKMLTMQQRMKRNLGSMVTRAEDLDKDLEHRVFMAWCALVQGHKKSIGGLKNPHVTSGTAGTRFTRRTGGVVKATATLPRTKMLPSLLSPGPRSPRSMTAENTPRQLPASLIGEGASASSIADPTSESGLPILIRPIETNGPKVPWGGVSNLLRGLMQCNDSKALYHSTESGWQTDYRVSQGPGIPEPPILPWSARNCLATARLWNSL